MLKTKTWAAILAAVLLLALGASAALWFYHPQGTTVEILQNGKVLETIDLSRVKEPYELVIEDPRGGSNTVLVEPGRIRITEADCPDQICVKRGWLSDSAAPIVCLPHRLTIRVVGGAVADTATQ